MADAPAPDDPKPTLARRRGRLSNPTTLQKVLSVAWDAAALRREIYREIENAIARKVSRASGDDLSITGIQRVDWGSLRADVVDEVTVKLSLITDTECFVDVYSDYREGTAENRAFCHEFNRQHKSALNRARFHDGYDIEHELAIGILHSVSGGLGIWWNPDHGMSYHWKALHPSNLLWARDASLNPAEWTWFAVRVWYPLHTLLEKVGEDAEIAKEAGWDVEAVQKFLKKHTELATVEKMGEPGWIDTVFEAADGIEYKKPDSVLFFLVYVKEWDGTWTKRIVASGSFTGKDGTRMTGDLHLLFKDEECCASIGEVIQVLQHEIMSPTLDNCSGAGTQLLPYHDLENAFLNLMIGRILMSSGLIIQAEDDATIEAWENVVLGEMITLLPPEFKGQQVGLQSNLGELSGLRQTIDALRRERSRSFGATPNVPDPVRTAAATQLLFQSESALDTMAAGHYLRQMGRFWFAQVHSMLSELPEEQPGAYTQEWFLSKLVRAGVPLEAIFGSRQVPGEKEDAWKERIKKAGIQPDPEHPGRFLAIPKQEGQAAERIVASEGIYLVHAAQLIGCGNSVNAQIAFGNLKELLPKMTEFGRREVLRAHVAAVTRSWGMADLTFPRSLLDPTEEEEIQDALEENAILAPLLTQSRGLMVSSADNHLVHADQHSAEALKLVDAIRTGQVEPQSGLMMVALLRNHAGYDENGVGNGGHWAFLEQDPDAQDIQKEINKRWNTVINAERTIIGKLRQQAQQQQAEAQALAQEQGVQLTPKQQFELDRDQRRAQMAEEEHQQKMRQAQEEHAVKMQILQDNARIKPDANAGGQA